MEDPGESRENLVASGALVPILFHLDLTLCSLQTVRARQSPLVLSNSFVNSYATHLLLSLSRLL